MSDLFQKSRKKRAKEIRLALEVLGQLVGCSCSPKGMREKVDFRFLRLKLIELFPSCVVEINRTASGIENYDTISIKLGPEGDENTLYVHIYGRTIDITYAGPD